MNNKTGVSRADLIRIFFKYGIEGLIQGAEATGFYQKKIVTPPALRVKEHRADFSDDGKIEFNIQLEDGLTKAPSLDFWIPVKYEESPEKDENSVRNKLEGVKGYKSDNSEIKGDPTKIPPKTSPLIPWSRLWPFLFNALSLNKEFSKVDEKEAVRIISTGSALKSIPFKKKMTWAQSSQIILDYNHNLTPLWDEISELYNSLEKLRGKFGLEVLQAESMPEGPYINRDIGFSYRVPEQGSPIFIISDLGYYDKTGKRRSAWILFGKRLRRAGFKPIVLVPCPERMWEEELTKYFYHVCWDRGMGALAMCHKDKIQVKYQNYEDRVYTDVEERLLSLISPALAVEPGLLRALRYQLPVAKSDIGIEISLWNSEMVKTSSIHCELRTEYIKEYRSRFNEEGELKEKTIEHIKQYHRHYPLPVRVKEARIAGYLGCNDTIDGIGQDIYMDRLIRTMDNENHPDRDGIKNFINRMEPRMCAGMAGNDRKLAICWAKANREEWLEGKIDDLPYWINMDDIEWILAERLEAERWLLLQRGEDLIFKKLALFLKDLDAYRENMLFAPGSPIASFTLSRRIVTIRSRETENIHSGNEALQPIKTSGLKERARSIYLGNVGSVEYNPEDTCELSFETDHESIRIDIRQRGKNVSAIGRDEYGLYEDVKIMGLVQRFRYIPPGKFLMGSPENEEERWRERELQHKVVLTRGFWLADTVCTQELWKTVMGVNPSRFTDNIKNPVEQVSWNECKVFMDEINKQESSLELRLPTEAEWEYACRAGTETPFSFGENITIDQVNYNGKHPYSGGRRGEYRKKSVEVKFDGFECNGWGLYQMHGNVWEWCEDWFGDYNLEDKTDPEGPEDGEYRVLRGGSWIDGGRDVRSACRFRSEPGHRDDITGFRLARGQ